MIKPIKVEDHSVEVPTREVVQPEAVVTKTEEDTKIEEATKIEGLNNLREETISRLREVKEEAPEVIIKEESTSKEEEEVPTTTEVASIAEAVATMKEVVELEEAVDTATTIKGTTKTEMATTQLLTRWKDTI